MSLGASIGERGHSETEGALPRTFFGHPSFEGVWTTNFLLPLEATPLARSLRLSESEAQAMASEMVRLALLDPLVAIDPEAPDILGSTNGLAIVRGERRSRAVIVPADGMLPYTAQARAEAGKFDLMRLPSDNPEERPSGERCIVGGGQPPLAGTVSLNPRQFIQTPEYVVIHNEFGDEARIVPFADSHSPTALHSRLGSSIARWEGDTLVVETINLPGEDRVRGFPTLIVDPSAKVIERFTRLDHEELLYQFTVEDPHVYTRPWLAEYSLYRTEQRMFPYACHEANYSLTNILMAQRMVEQNAGVRD